MAMFSAYLTFDGNCNGAMTFYAAMLGGDLQVFRMGDSPMAGALMAADTMPGQSFQPMQGVSITLACRDVEQGRLVFEAMSAGGQAEPVPRRPLDRAVPIRASREARRNH